MEAANEKVAKKPMSTTKQVGLLVLLAIPLGILVGLGVFKWIVDVILAVSVGIMYWVMWYHMCHPSMTSNPYRPILRKPLKWWTWMVLGYSALYAAVFFLSLYITMAALAIALVLDIWKGTATWWYFRKTGNKP